VRGGLTSISGRGVEIESAERATVTGSTGLHVQTLAGAGCLLSTDQVSISAAGTVAAVAAASTRIHAMARAIRISG
jgi:hypothetical protein